MTRTVVVTGSASGMGAATAELLTADGVRVIGVDRQDADVVADLSTPAGREAALAEITGRADRLDGLATFAGLSGLSDRPGDVVVSVNYFGSVAFLEGLRPLLALGERPAALAITSNSTTTTPGVPLAVADACLSGDESAARATANEVGSLSAYPASKVAIARWVRRHAPTADWIGAGVNLNALAPGSTATGMTVEVAADPVVGKLMDRFPVPLGRSATATELAHVAVFLLGPTARAFVGSVVFCDAGTDALMRPDDWPAPMAMPGA